MKCFKLSFGFLVVAQLSVALFVPESNGIVARQNGNNNQNGGKNNGGNGGNNAQTSTTLDPSVIQKIDGTAAEGEATSLVSTNNFIGFCLNKALTNGKQVAGGSCNPTPMGDIPSSTNMPSVKFENPPNGGNIPANQPFTVIMNIKGMETGSFTNAANTYYAAPQQLNGNGQIVGHNHVVIEAIPSLDSTTPTNPQKFAFFKGLNDAAANGQLTADVTSGLAAGTYRMSSITSSSNHQSVLMPVAQRGAVDDVVYFTVGGNGGNNANGNNNANANNTANGNNNTANGNNNTANGNNNTANGNTNGGNNGKGGRNGGRNGRRYERRFFTWH